MSKKRITNRYLNPIPITTKQGRKILTPFVAQDVDVTEDAIAQARSAAQGMLRVDEVPQPKPRKKATKSRDVKASTDSETPDATENTESNTGGKE